MSDFDLTSLDAQDESQLAIRHPKTLAPTSWIWTFYGPAHPKTVALADRVSKDALKRAAAQRSARLNGKKVKDDDEQTPDEIRGENVDNILIRTAGFSPVSINGVEVTFSLAAAREMLLDRKKGWLLGQVMEFLSDEASFILPSAKA
jgi:hypothetical protein